MNAILIHERRYVMNKVKIGIGVGFGLVIAGILAGRHFASESVKPDTSNATAGADGASASSTPSPLTPVEVTFLYGSDKKEWIESAAEGFRRSHPEIKLTLVARGSMDGAQGILDRRDRPTVFSPADSLALNMLAADWKNKGREPLFAESGDDAPTSLVMTPLVFVAWEDRARALMKENNGEISWKALEKATTSPQGWPGVGGKADWGFVKLGHTDPTRSNSGLQAVMLMALEQTGKPQLETADLVDPKVSTFVRHIEKSVPSFEASTGTFMTEMVRFGPSKYDVAVVYENLAIAQIDTAQARWGALRVYYPKTTMWSDHPAAVLQAEWVTPEQKAAGHEWLAYLRSRPVQQRALSYGFRPGDTSVPVRTSDAQNPFTRLGRYGVRVDVPHAARTPDVATVRNVTMMWSRTCAPRSHDDGAVR